MRHPCDEHYDDPDYEEEICTKCNGSGEGQYDGTQCWWCKGWGVEYKLREEKDDAI